MATHSSTLVWKIYGQRLQSEDVIWHLYCCSLSHVQLFVTPWTAAHQASLSFTISMSQTHVHWVTDAPTISSHGIYIALPKRISKC